MTKEFRPRPLSMRRVLIPKRGFHLPFCQGCCKPITTQFAMSQYNQLQATWKKHWAVAAAAKRIEDNTGLPKPADAIRTADLLGETKR